MIHHINKMKDKNFITISIDTVRTFDKLQYPFMIKTLNKADIRGMYLNTIKVIYEKPTAKIIFNW